MKADKNTLIPTLKRILGYPVPRPTKLGVGRVSVCFLLRGLNRLVLYVAAFGLEVLHVGAAALVFGV